MTKDEVDAYAFAALLFTLNVYFYCVWWSSPLTAAHIASEAVFSVSAAHIASEAVFSAYRRFLCASLEFAETYGFAVFALTLTIYFYCAWCSSTASAAHTKAEPACCRFIGGCKNRMRISSQRILRRPCPKRTQSRFPRRPYSQRPQSPSTCSGSSAILSGMFLPFLPSWIVPFFWLPSMGHASSTSAISLHCETFTQLIFDAVVGNATIASKHTSPFLFDPEAALVTTSTLEVDPHRTGSHQLVLSIHGLKYTETFWYNDDSNVYDLQAHIRKLFKKLRIDDTFTIEHVCNRSSMLNSQGPKLHVKLKDVNLSPNWITIFPRKYKIPVSGGAPIQTPTKKRKCLTASKLIRAQKKRKLNAKRDLDKRKQKRKEQYTAERAAQRQARYDSEQRQAQYDSEQRQAQYDSEQRQAQYDSEQRQARYEREKKEKDKLDEKTRKEREAKGEEKKEKARKKREAEKQRQFDKTHNTFRITGDIDEKDERFQTHYLGKMDQECQKCGARMFEGERLKSGGFSLCCGDGKLHLPKLRKLPDKLTEYLTDKTPEARYFRKHIRSINAAFAFASLRVTNESLPAGSFRISGNMCHRMGRTFVPEQDVKFASIYFYDCGNELENRLKFTHAPATKSKVEETVFYEVQKILHELNPFYKQFKHAFERFQESPLQEFCIVLKTDIKPEKAHAGCYNAPSSVCQVAAIIPGYDEEDEEGYTKNHREIVLYCRPALREKDMCMNKQNELVPKQVYISEKHPHYDPLQYVVMAPYGTLGWAPDTILTEKGHRAHAVGEISEDDENASGSEDSEMRDAEIEDGDRAESASFIRQLKGQLRRKKQKKKKEEKKKKKRVGARYVNCRKYYKYYAMIRGQKDSDNQRQRFGKLFQQYMTDMWAKIEANDLSYVFHNQGSLRAASRNGLEDAIDNGGDVNEVGKEMILPASHTGSRKWFHSKYQDAMSIVQEFKKPDLFITFTTNSKWREITENLFENQNAYDRPDLVARVFELKKKELIADLYDRGVLGRKVAHVHTVEFQKRGLPHIHLLIILSEQDALKNSDDFDAVTCAEIPNKATNPRLYELVKNNMIHHHTSMCEKDGAGSCSKYFPKDFAERTDTQEDGYPLYRRRGPEHGGAQIRVKKKKRKGKTKVTHTIVNNGFVVPYNAALLLKYNCHINVEVCSTVRSVKYLYKYVYKGADRSMVAIEKKGNGTSKAKSKTPVNQIKQYVDCRYLSSIEASYRMFECNMHGRAPSVLPLYVHLPRENYMTYDPKRTYEDLKKACANSKNTTMTQFFKRNELERKQPLSDIERMRDRDGNLKPAGPELLYHEFPKFYRWCQSEKKWERRKRHDWQIGRMHTSYPGQGERWYLRILLNHVRGPTSYENLLTYEGKQYLCFKERCMAQELLEDDKEWDAVLTEAKEIQSAFQMRRLFVTLVKWCFPTEPDVLWNKYKDAMIEDMEYLYKRSTGAPVHLFTISDKVRQTMYNAALYDICERLESYDIDPSKQNLIKPLKSDCFQMEAKEILNERKYNQVEAREEYKQRETQMNDEQRLIFECISDILYGEALRQEDSNTCFFIDAPGGAGKTYVCNALLALVRSHGDIALACASSGIAATNYKGGRTIHSRFKCPIPIRANSTNELSLPQKKLLMETQLIIWDEAPMQQKWIMENVDRTLKDIMKSKEPFGGKVMVFCGDFRQVAPVIPRAGRAQIITKAISNSKLWTHIVSLSLTVNERLNRTPNISPAQLSKLQWWAEYLLQIGEDKVPKKNDLIEIPKHLLSSATTTAALIDETYGRLDQPESEEQHVRLLQHSILTPKNVDVRNVNRIAIEKLAGTGTTYESINSVVDERHAYTYTEEYLQSLELNGFPAHKLQLKIGAPIMVLRNIDPLNSVCNGTKGIVTRLMPHLIEMELRDVDGNPKMVLIHRVSLQPSDSQLPIKFWRRQFPVALCFAMTINKSQGQTLQKVGLFLPKPVFGHGQLYVALSRVTHPDNIKLLIETTSQHGVMKELGEGVYTKNVVYTEILSTVGIIDRNHPRPPAAVIYECEMDDPDEEEEEKEYDEEEETSLPLKQAYKRKQSDKREMDASSSEESEDLDLE